ncbi:MAG: chromate efflux transporter [Saprospiraceae bacterium]|nr:chromate efflux transporter [Bacteroidia bacterium]NNE13799.1 chromate efflux transporter [Saprospiraceae bacterium]NNL93047.1 chromate efflux transporter [Saprospiraceae bacterium]
MSDKIKEVFLYFFKLGFVAFGGPAAHVAMMEKDLVENKKWLTTEDFLDYMGATNLIPGPNSTEMTMHCGYHRAGVAGLFVGGVSFIFPAALLTLLVAIFFEKTSELAWMIPILNGIKAAVISFIIGAIIKLGKKAIKTQVLLALGILTIILNVLGLNEIFCILIVGFLGLIIHLSTHNRTANSFILPLLLMANIGYSHLKLFLIFFKVGLVLFGSGYVLFAYLDGELVSNVEWLTRPDLVEAIAIGQMTPGPVLSTATFIGYKLGGLSGACLATLGIFIPSFFYVLLLHRFLKKMKSSKILKAFLAAVNVAAVAVMVVVTFKMAQSIVIDWRTATIGVVACFVYFYWNKISTLWIIFGGALSGYLLSFITF